ncbi:sulfatase family protein [Pelagicoccus mobilis]|uniref:Sulfatase n=1 Tax=Pelagicoccus mobilis TaxID=415221 RepID=A0A934S0I4_9BACT|nr:sulfatase [Pelagicoccus mobilis]MBK1877224.1 sulfatase [Pelagicoccus mobilis]
MKNLIIGFIAVLICSVAHAESLSGSRPNVVFFLGDDQSLFDHSAYGSTKAPTPTTDVFADQALVFDRAFTGQAICAPSRSMLYTGLYPIRNGCFINHTEIRKGVETLPSYLGKLGYDVVLAGKSHVGPQDQFQWSQWFMPVEVEGKPRPGIPLGKMDAYMASADEPFCMLVTSEYPHSPYFKETPFGPEDVDLPAFVKDTEPRRKHVARYYASIAEKEREFAAVLEMLEKHGLAENTIVFYSDDHGTARGKFTVYDSGLNVAFMVRWPGKIQAGRTDALTSYADFVPTVLDLAGGDAPSDLDGNSLLPLFEGKSGENHDYVYGVAHSQGIQEREVFPQRTVHDGRYHYIYSFNSLERVEREQAAGRPVNYFLERGARKYKSRPEEELYDTLADPHELKNLASDERFASVKARLKKEMFSWMKNQNDYLSEGDWAKFLKVRRHELDIQDPKYNYKIPEGQVGSLKGKKLDPYKITEPK